MNGRARPPVLALHLGILALLLALQTVLPPFHHGMLARIMVLAAYAVGYNVLLGYTGLMSLGHAMLFASGMYATGLSIYHLGFGAASGFLLGVLASVAAAAVVGYWWWRAPQSTRIKAGAPAPELALQSIGSPGSTRISQFRGRPVLLTMFVDACPACVEVIGRLERLHREFGRHGLVVLGVATDLDPAARARYVKDLGITFFVLQDPGGIAIQEAYGTTRLPELYLIDGGGTVEAVYLGRLAEREADLRDRITKLLGRSKPR